jgi:hypothetical protein
MSSYISKTTLTQVYISKPHRIGDKKAKVNQFGKYQGKVNQNLVYRVIWTWLNLEGVNWTLTYFLYPMLPYC